MCGIAAFSLSPYSKVNARQLSHALLTQIENRGSHASGFAAIDRDGQSHIFKNNQPGSQLPLALMPRGSKNVILHTRYATQGPPSDNNNNHPVLSTDGKVAVVHNGVINNDHTLREPLGITERHGLVDSLVIPSLIAQQGVDSLHKLSGYAAIAWLDARERDQALHIAKLKTSPVAYTHLYDGSFVMASTEALLTKALDSVGLSHGGVFELSDQKMIRVNDGFIYTHEVAPRMSYSASAYSRYSGATSGGHGSSTSRATGVTRSTGPVGSEATKSTYVGANNAPASGSGKGSEDVTDVDIDNYMEDLERWRAKRAADDEKSRKLANEAIRAETGKAMALGMADDLDDDDDENYASLDQLIAAMEEEDKQKNLEEAMACTVAGTSVGSRYLQGEGFYIVDSDGDMTHHPVLEDLEARLRWLSKMGKTDTDQFQVEDHIHWVNNIWDIGSVDEDGNLISWVEDMSDIDEHESPSVRHLNYIREGVGKLSSVRGS